MRWLVVGGAGFIGSHLMERLDDAACFDLQFGHDARDTMLLASAMRDVDQVALLASNPDLAAAQHDPDLDFRDGTMITRSCLEAMRHASVRRLVYLSGSGVYGDQHGRWCTERDVAMPASPYGASKLASEALIAAYQQFGILDHVLILRPANVVGPNLTHGVVHDLAAKLRHDPTRLEVLGDGRQSKHYVHVDDVVDVICSGLAGTFNIAPKDFVTVAWIVRQLCDQLQVSPTVEYAGGPAGWPGDVPVVRLDTTRLRCTGWRARWSAADAIREAIRCV